MQIQAEPLRRLVADIFTAAGCASDESARIAHYLVSANLAGHDSHGVIRVSRYVQWMDAGRLVPGRRLTVISDNAVMAVVDGEYGFGQTIGPLAVQMGIGMAEKNGVAVVALRNSGHLGRIGDWSEMAAIAGQISIHFVNIAGGRLVAPFGAAERRMCTNPICIGVPMAEGPPLILDFATSLVAEGKVLVAARGGKAVPEGSLIDADGGLSTDPKVLYGDSGDTGNFDPNAGPGCLRTMGEHKGSGLAFMCEILAGALTGSGCAGPKKHKGANGMLSIYMAARYFDSNDLFAVDVRDYVEYFKSARPANPGGEVLAPGDPEVRNRAQRLADGVPLPDATWQGILGTAREKGISEAAIKAVVGA